MFWNRGAIEVYPDVVLGADKMRPLEAIGWYHRNVETPYFMENIKVQGLEDAPTLKNPLPNRTFGALVFCDAPVWESETALAAKPGKSHRFDVVAYCEQTETLDQWFDATLKIADEARKTPIETRRETTLARWRDFDGRSWVSFSPNEKALADATPERRAEVAAETADVNLAYMLQRYVFACQGRGRYPVKFNGGLFTVRPDDTTPGGHDYRRWGTGWWWQNTRLSYYAAYAAGDFDLARPFLDMYEAALPLRKFATKKYFGFEDAAYFIECAYSNGEAFPEVYGTQLWSEREDKLQASGWHRWEWVGGLELSLFMLNYALYTEDDNYLKTVAIPTSNAVLRFFKGFYKIDAATGKLRMTPSQALETWWECENPSTEISGIRAVIEALQALPEEQTKAEDREFWAEMLAITPEIPTLKTDDGAIALAPAAKFAQLHNVETPELYAVFPFRQFAFEKPNADWAKVALEKRLNKQKGGWSQDPLFYSYLGLTEGAREHVLVRARTKHAASRFPAFWGPNFDWVPDQDHGGILMTAVQSLAMQTSGKTIFVTPSLPSEWDVEFKLWAPEKTTVVGKSVGGEIVDLKVEPAERRADVKIIG
ncbi:MAG: hypothetical protein HUK22_08555, partial [Thermoguttaceae bacterium]|nr:hypothetical protein [Thermoguttaceae bacterium]